MQGISYCKYLLSIESRESFLKYKMYSGHVEYNPAKFGGVIFFPLGRNRGRKNILATKKGSSKIAESLAINW